MKLKEKTMEIAVAMVGIGLTVIWDCISLYVEKQRRTSGKYACESETNNRDSGKNDGESGKNDGESGKNGGESGKI
ncbi:MAG: hypothetical protein FVQ77_04510 [Cytophagales bacterium]|nr:hypothetical protein [Cytophagales bacterium]